MADKYLDNFSYIFIPFSLEQPEAFHNFHKRLEKNPGWELVEDEIRYLHRYVSEKLVSRTGGEHNAYHFRLNEAFARKQNLHLNAQWYSTDAKSFRDQKEYRFEFSIANAELFVFNTDIGMLAFELRFKNNDPFEIAAAQYCLRKITAEKIHFSGQTGSPVRESFVDIARRILDDSLTSSEVDFFFYDSPQNERANLLTYIDVPVKDNYDEELFFLKWCYNDLFDADDAACEDGSENYLASTNTAWGISASAAVCLASRSEKRKEFIETVFQDNFRGQYLLTYVLLLHQKYKMYHFLTKLAVGIDGNLAELEKYKHRLYEFETHYMFSRISEVPQYQRFYEKTKKAIALEEMFRDVQEPLAQLAEIQKQIAEKAQRDYDKKINTILTTLSLLTIVSALTDATSITSELEWLVSPTVSRIIQLVMVGIVLVVGIFMLFRLIFLKNKH